MKLSQRILIGILAILIAVVGVMYWVTNTKLSQTLEELSNTKVDLIWTQYKLEDTKDRLTDTETTLNETQTELSSTKATLTETQAELLSTKSSLASTAMELEKEQSRYTSLTNSYSDIRSQINFRMGDGEDAKAFVTPEDSILTVMVEDITGGFSEVDSWSDYKRLYDWVVDNIEYSSDTPLPNLPSDPTDSALGWQSDYWRMPKETMQDKAGDCEDMALLLASMIINYRQERYATWVISIQNSYGGHLAVAFPVQGGNLTILDPAGNYYTGYLGYYLSSNNTSYEIKNWLALWSDKLPGAYVSGVFTDKFYKTFTSTEEFITWVAER